MIFAAGLGTRLRPLTLTRPKALVGVAGVSVLERVARRLVAAGADRMIINTHPFPEQIEQLVQARDGFGVEVFFSHEPEEPLDTATGLQQAAPLFRRDAPFFLHNCDVLSTVDLSALYEQHLAHDAITTLAVLPPSPQRYLIFDDAGLCGYAPRGGDSDVYARDAQGEAVRRDFTGIHVVSPALLDTLQYRAPYSIISHYLSLARAGERIAKHDEPDATWIDIGSHEKLAAAEELVRLGRLE